MSVSRIKKILRELIGSENILTNNVLFIDFTGDHASAQLLSQIWYWTGKTKMRGGWFAKTYQQWFEETRIKKHSVRRYAKRFEELGFLEIKFQKFNRVPTPHYRLDENELIQQLLYFLDNADREFLDDDEQGSQVVTGSQNVTVEGHNLLPSSEGHNLLPSINKERFKNIDLNGPSDIDKAIIDKIGPKHASVIRRLKGAGVEFPFKRDFRFALVEWLEHRKQKRSLYTESGLRSMLTMVANFDEEFICTKMAVARTNGWKGFLFPEDMERYFKQKGNTNGSAAKYDDNLKQTFEDLQREGFV